MALCSTREPSAAAFVARVALMFLGVCCLPLVSRAASDPPPVWSSQEQPIADQMHGLRKLPDDARAARTRELSLQIRELPASPNKLRLAGGLANLSTEGDFGHETLQAVANTLAAVLGEQPPPAGDGTPGDLYMELASLARYEGVQVTLKDPQYAAALTRLEADDDRRQKADFSLTDLDGRKWSLKELRGKVVLVNFWATWCPPCRKEVPDLEALYLRFKDQGFVVLAISDEDAGALRPFVAGKNVTYPVLLDAGRAVNEQFRINGIPRSFIYDRTGKLVAQSIDMRTRAQFLELLARAGLKQAP